MNKRKGKDKARLDKLHENSLPEELAFDPSWAEVEALVRAAGQYVVPSDNLRPRVLEAAREKRNDQRGRRKILQCVAAILLCGALSLPLAERMEVWRDHTKSPSANDLELRAIQLSSRSNDGPHWGLLEAFNQLRESQATRLQRSLR